MVKLLIFVFAFINLWSTALAQTELRPVLKFEKDSVKIGEPIRVSLSVAYPSEEQILFPDTNYSLLPFELIKKEFFTTKSTKGISLDSVVYVVSTFSLDSVQTLKMPVYQFIGEDSTGWFSNEASIKVLQKFKGRLPEKPVFEYDNTNHPVALRINYPYILIGMAVIILLLFLFNFFFDRPIQKFIFLFLERRRHNSYLKLYDKNIKNLEKELSIENVEALLVNWRKYIQRVDGQPYTTFTSMEIFKVLPDKNLRDILQEIDRWIYGGIDMKDWRSNMEYVKQVSIQLYLKKRESIKDGKFE